MGVQADSWRVNTSLTKVDLQGATVGRSGAFAIAEVSTLDIHKMDIHTRCQRQEMMLHWKTCL